MCNSEAVPAKKCLSNASIVANTKVTVKDVYHTKSGEVYLHPLSLFV